MGGASLPARGPWPVGVATRSLRHQRPLPVEIWYPARLDTPAKELRSGDVFTVHPSLAARWQNAIRNAEPDGRLCPLVVFSHGGFGSRMNATSLCSNLASWGYLVVAPDHLGNTTADQIELAAGLKSDAGIEQSLVDRPNDLLQVLEWISSPQSGFVEFADARKVGLMGHSLGGWSVLKASECNDRINAIVAMAPAWGHAPASLEQNVLSYQDLRARLDLSAWKARVPTLVLAGQEDVLVRPSCMRTLFEELQCDKRLIELVGFGHTHFVDQANEGHRGLRALFARDVLAPGVDFSDIAGAMDAIDNLVSDRVAETTTSNLVRSHFDTVFTSPKASRMAPKIVTLNPEQEPA